MKKQQKFKKGNLVEVLTRDKIKNNKQAIIEYSYAEKYGGSNIDSYSVVFLDTGNSIAWKKTNELKLIDKGGEHLFEKANKNREQISIQNTDINYIVSKLEEGILSSESILFLFDMIGHNTSFKSNGEFFVLFSDWKQFYPIFLHIKNSKTLENAKSIFNEKGLNQYNIEKVYYTFKNTKAYK